MGAPKKQEYWPISKGIEEAKKLGIEISLPTVIKWCANPPYLGFQLGGPGGKWFVKPEKFMKYITSGVILEERHGKAN